MTLHRNFLDVKQDGQCQLWYTTGILSVMISLHCLGDCMNLDGIEVRVPLSMEGGMVLLVALAPIVQHLVAFLELGVAGCFSMFPRKAVGTQ